jgi:alkaline ceramidase TOD1/glycosyltransferase MUCI70-like protein
VVYSAIFGSIPDHLRAPARYRPDPSVRYVCFTDRPGSFPDPGPWELRAAAWTDADDRRTARYHKILSHELFPDTDYVLWLDGNIRLMAEPWSMIRRSLPDGFDLAAFKHRHRACVYEELDACIRLDKDGVEVMRAQVEGYRARGYPAGNGLAETGVLVRRQSEAVRGFNRAWWAEVEGGSVRDQLSFNYTLWTRGLRYALLRGRPDKSPDVRYQRHR